MGANPKFRTDLLRSDYEEADGSRSVVLKDPVSEKYFRLSPYEYELLQEFDGATSMDGAVETLARQGRHYPKEDANAIAAKAGTYGLLLGTRFGTAEALRKHKENLKKAKKASYFSRVYFLFIPVLNPDRFLEKTLWLYKLLFNRFTFGLTAIAVPGAAYLLITGLPRIQTEYLFFFNFQNLFCLWITIALTKLVHEFSHAYTAKRFGLHVPQMGIAFLIFFPCLYCNTTDAWQLADRRQRIAISAAGIMAEALIAVFATYVWYFTQPGLINSLAFYLVAVSLISTVLFNANPLIKFDGYFILIDLLRVPNLSTKSFGHLKYLFLNRIMGIAKVVDSAVAPRESVIFPLYGVAAFAYRVSLYTGIVVAVYYRFDKVLGMVLAVMAFFLFVVRPVVRGAKTVYSQRGEISPRFGGVLVFLVLVGIFAGLLLVPLSGRSVYPCYLVSARVQKLTVPLKTLVERVFIEEGSVVPQGMLLYTLDTSELNLALHKKSGERELLVKELRLMLLSDEKRAEVPSKEVQVLQADDAIDKIREELRIAKSGIDAPFRGVVTFLDYRMQEGYQPGEGGIVGQLESTDACRVYALIPEQDLHKVRKGLEVSVWFPLGAGKTFTRKIEEIRPYSERDLKDSPFSSRLGGELATEETGRDLRDAPLEPQYLVSAGFRNDKEAIPLGMTGKFVVPLPPRSLASSFLTRLVKVFRRESLF
ncbi:MAG: site-2 protease family protein [Thermodesulfobacteriota bacterium]